VGLAGGRKRTSRHPSTPVLALTRPFWRLARLCSCGKPGTSAMALSFTAVVSRELPAVHAQAPAVALPASEFEFAGHGTAAVVSSAPPVCVPGQNEPAGHGSQVTDTLA